jgi:hypothetical protein
MTGRWFSLGLCLEVDVLAVAALAAGIAAPRKHFSPFVLQRKQADVGEEFKVYFHETWILCRTMLYDTCRTMLYNMDFVSHHVVQHVAPCCTTWLLCRTMLYDM